MKNEWGAKEHEYNLLKYIEDLHISPTPYYISKNNELGQDFTILEFIEGENINKFSKEMILSVANILKTLHSSHEFKFLEGGIPPTENTEYECSVFDEFTNGEDKKIEKYHNLPEIERVYEIYNRILNKLGKWFSKKDFNNIHNFCICHADLKKENLLQYNNEIRLIDWEYSGIDIPETDIGRLFAGCGFTREEEILFLNEYYNNQLNTISLDRIYAVKTVLLFFKIIEDYILIKRKDWNADNMKMIMFNQET